MEMNYKIESENFVTRILLSHEFNVLPIKIEEIVKSLEITIKRYEFNEDVSGVLVIDENGQAIIGYNPNESESRKRFSIAHELGHYILHSNKSKGIFIDKLMFRKNIKLYSKKEEKIEAEANYFAANLLMPKSLLLEEIKKLDSYADDDQNIGRLATIFNVSISAMTYRLINLGIYTGTTF